MRPHLRDVDVGNRDVGVGMDGEIKSALQVEATRARIVPVPQSKKTGWRGPESAHSLGGFAAAQKLTKKQRVARALKAIRARYAKLRPAA